jgi:DNA mismatch repair protein MutS
MYDQQNMQQQTLYDQYASLTQEYKAKYGDDTVVLMEVGSFLEYYDCDRRLGADVPRISQILNVQATRRNKSVAEVSRTNPSMGGIPSVAATKYINVLVEAGFTVVLCRQVPGTNPPKREVTEVLSAATGVCSDFCVDRGVPSSAVASLPPAILVVHVEAGKGWQAIGWAVLELATGRSTVGEASSRPWESLRSWVVDRIGCTVCVSEVVVSMSMNKKEDNEDDVCDRVCSHVGQPRRAVRVRPALVDPVEQNRVLERAYPCRGMLTPAEFVDLERSPYALAAFCLAVAYAAEHRACLVNRLLRPERVVVDEDVARHMELSASTLQQLGVVGTGESSEGTLMHLLNRCRTAMGRRAFRARLAMPMSDAAVLEARWAEVGTMVIDRGDAGVSDVRKALDGIGIDLETAFRSLCLKRASASDLASLASGLLAARAAVLMVCEKNDDGCKCNATCEAIAAAVHARLDQDATSPSSKNPFRRGVNATVDAAHDELDSARSVFYQAAAALNAEIGQDHVRIEDADIMFLSVTGRRWAAAVASGAAGRARVEPWFSGRDCTLQTDGGGPPRLQHPLLGAEASERVRRASSALAARVSEALSQLQDEIVDAYADPFWSFVAPRVADVDVLACCAHNAIRLGHTRPSIDAAEKNDVSAVALRHPVIEVLSGRRDAYVANDISLGSDAGMVLYGINAVGKSSLMKAVGLAVVMAQCGMFVAANSFVMRAPFQRLFTRIGLRDDLLRGQSTFMVEMRDLRDILRHATDRRSLVIGDELCAGTESASALAIVGAGVLHLTRRGVPFVFATHLHELLDVPVVRAAIDEKRLQVAHLSVHYDEAVDGRLVYDRRLAPGSGDACYGLEVCKALDLDAAFLVTAETIRASMTSEKTSWMRSRRSKYNGGCIVDVCAVCGDPASDTHHIKPQKLRGELGNARMDHVSNLAPLCERCHHDVHRGKLDIAGFVATSDGVKLRLQKS